MSNPGFAATSGTVTLTDTLPTGLTATAISGSGWTCTLGTLTCTRSDALAASASYPAITLTVSVANNAAASLTNTATVSGGGETNVANDTANDVTTIIPLPDLTVTKSHIGNFTQGQTGATYSITASNVGFAPTSGTVTLTDPLPLSTAAVTSDLVNDWSLTNNPNGPWTFLQGTTVLPHQFQTSSPTPPSGDFFGPCAVPGCFLPAFWKGTNFIQIHSVDSGNGNPANGEATLKWTSPITGVVSLNGKIWNGQPGASRSNDFFLSLGATLLQSGTVSDVVAFDQAHAIPLSATQLVNAGDVITLVIQRSPGFTPGTIADMSLTINATPGLTAPALGGTGWTCTLGTLTCTRSDALAAGSSYPAVTLTVNVPNNAPASITNTATVSGGGQVNTSNDTVNDVRPPIKPAARLDGCAKSHTGNFTQGQTGATYTITVTNSGAPTSRAP